jgi:O-antigen ligase
MSTSAEGIGPTYLPFRIASSLIPALGMFLGLATLAVFLSIGTYAGQEATIIGLFVAALAMAVVLVRPQVGVLLLVTNFLIASYPTPIRGQGLLTINNILGIVLSVILIAQLARSPDLFFLRVPQIRIYLVIGVVFIISTIASSYQFPDLRFTYGTGGKTGVIRSLDQTSMMAKTFITRLAFVVLSLHFLRQERDIMRLVSVFMICLVMVVPSAVSGYFTATDVAYYRAEASFSAGTNANRLAFICLVQISFWWHFARSKKGVLRSVSYVVIVSLIFTTLLTASRSGALGLLIVFALLARSTGGGPKISRVQVVAFLLITLGILVTAIPEQNIERIQNLDPTATKKSGGVGSYSTQRRVETVETGWQMFGDYPLFGVGIGNFRPVAQQVYFDPFFRPPHNSYIWALAEGGILFFGLYLYLYWVTWRDIQWLKRARAMPPSLQWIAAALEAALILMLFFSAFADIWLNAITYILIVMVMASKNYVSSRQIVIV